MSAQGLLGTVLATQLVEAIDKDDFIGAAGDVAAGRFGPNLTALVRDIARQLDEHNRLALALAEMVQSAECDISSEYGGTSSHDERQAALQPYRDLLAAVEGGAA